MSEFFKISERFQNKTSFNNLSYVKILLSNFFLNVLDNGKLLECSVILFKNNVNFFFKLNLID